MKSNRWGHGEKICHKSRGNVIPALTDHALMPPLIFIYYFNPTFLYFKIIISYNISSFVETLNHFLQSQQNALFTFIFELVPNRFSYWAH